MVSDDSRYVPVLMTIEELLLNRSPGGRNVDQNMVLQRMGLDYRDEMVRDEMAARMSEMMDKGLVVGPTPLTGDNKVMDVTVTAITESGHQLVVQTKQARRVQFLRALYKTTRGNRLQPVAPQEIGDQLGMGADETDGVVQYLSDARFLKWISFGRIPIEHAGVVAVEKMETPQKADDTKSSMVHNEMHIHGSVYGSQIQQSTDQSTQVMEIASPAEVEAVRAWAARVRAAESSLGLSSEVLDAINEELTRLEAHTKSSSPPRRALRASADAVGTILKLAVGEAAALELVKELPRLVQLLTGSG